ncbi:MAG TPA: cytochrome c biogenesis protein CcdA [bacterium]|nr:MAG: Thiol:disulfide interchange protein DsbD precursor [bacterium ADurb.Bin236]HOY61705.1 cytochrome c biogenesis protein CcdA [bacterium]HPI75877.1 cytochrome c biogenesis protein CcdA [bacterium]HPN95258.1 cytochrome c biogenesis protein CcdA [bacterium]
MLESFADGFFRHVTDAPLLAFAAAFAAGLLTSLTPCVYPMIPITAAYLGGRGAGGSFRRSVGLSACYILGLALMYSALGAVAALSGVIFGSWAGNPYLNLFIAVFFVLLGLSMLDVFSLPMPGFMAKLSAGGGAGGYAGAFMVGVVSSLVSTPCTAPVVMAILTLVATTGNVAYGASLLFVFALGMGLLLAVVGASAGALAALPKSGRWMLAVKWFFGVALIAAGIWFGYKAAVMLF